MKIKVLIISILFVAVTFIAKAQKEEFKLSSFTPPEFVYKSLDLYYDLSGSLSREAGYYDDSLSLKNIINYFSTSISPRYSRYANRADYQGSNDILFYAGFGINKDDPYYSSHSSDQYHLQNGNAVKIYYDGQNRFYRPDKWFVEIDPTVRLITQTTKYTDKTFLGDSLALQITTTLWRPTVYIMAPILVGYGRIDNIMDARHAIYILDDLEKAGRLSRKFNDEDITALATNISKLKNKRFFDYRIRKIEELVALDSLLRSAHLNGETDAMFYATLNDSWNYPGVSYRYSGYRIYGGIDPEYQLNHSSTKNDWKYSPQENSKSWENVSSAYLGLRAGYKYEKPVSLRWQSSIDIWAGYGIEQNIRKGKMILPEPWDTRVSKTTQQRGNISAVFSVGYYPNSRTWLKTGIDASVYYYGKGTDKSYGIEETGMLPSVYGTLGPDFAAYFYLSPQLRLEFIGNIDYSYNWAKYKTNLADHFSYNKWNLYVNSRLTYSIF